jgi:hypothetical protein
VNKRSRFGEAASKLAWFPLALVLWLFTPVRKVRVQVPGAGFGDDHTYYRGFPFLAQSDAPMFSLATDNYIFPLAANLAFFTVLACLLAWAWRRRPFLQYRELDWIVGLPTYILGAFCLFVTAMWIFVADTFFFWWIDKSGWRSVEGFVLPFP